MGIVEKKMESAKYIGVRVLHGVHRAASFKLGSDRRGLSAECTHCVLLGSVEASATPSPKPINPTPKHHPCWKLGPW